MTYGLISFTAGSSTVTEFLLSKGIPVDIDYGFGTPLYHACINEQDKTEDFVEPSCKCNQPHPFLFCFDSLSRFLWIEKKIVCMNNYSVFIYMSY